MTVKDIITQWLKDNKFDGLYTPGECGCKIDSLAPCDSDCIIHCKPGVLRETDEDSECDFSIGAKPEKKQRTVNDVNKRSKRTKT